MATRDQVRTMIRAMPFRSFHVRLNSGRTFVIRHPENIACSLMDHGMTIYDEEGTHLVDGLLVEVIEPVPAEKVSGGNGG